MSDCWPPTGGNWEGGTVAGGHRWTHVPHVGWRDDGPAIDRRPFVLPPDPTTTGRVNPIPGKRIHYGGRYPARRHLLARWLRTRRGHVVTFTAALVVGGYAATVALFFDRTLPTFRSAGALVAVAVVLVAVLLAVVLWARHE